MLKRLALLTPIFLLSFGLLSSPEAEACSCKFPKDAQEAAQNAEVVITAFPRSVNTESDGVNILEFEVTQTWKGDIKKGSRTKGTTRNSPAACGLPFELDQEYLIYGSMNREGLLSVNSCSRSGTVTTLSEDVVMLNSLPPEQLTRSTARNPNSVGTNSNLTQKPSPSQEDPATAQQNPLEASDTPQKEEKTAASPPPASSNARGCNLTESDNSYAWWALVLLAIRRRRASKKNAL